MRMRNVCMYVCMYVCISNHACVHVYVYVYECAYAHTHIPAVWGTASDRQVTIAL
jgi:hypothetical protein